MTRAQDDTVEKLKQWTETFSRVKFQVYERKEQFTPADVFVGLHNDAIASLVLRLAPKIADEDQIMEEAKASLLRVAAPDAIARLSETELPHEEFEDLCQKYYESHFPTLGEAILKNLAYSEEPLLFITTQSRLLTKEGQDALNRYLGTPVMILPLQQINTERQFRERLKNFLKPQKDKVLIVQAQLVHQKQANSLVECARYIIQDELKQRGDGQFKCCIAIVLQVSC